MSKQDDVDRQKAIEPTDIVSSLSLVASPTVGSQIGLRKENDLPTKDCRDRLIDRLLALKLMGLIVSELADELPICAEPELRTEALRCGILTLREFVLDDAQDCGFNLKQLEKAVCREFRCVGDGLPSWAAALGVGSFDEEFDYGC